MSVATAVQLRSADPSAAGATSPMTGSLRMVICSMEQGVREFPHCDIIVLVGAQSLEIAAVRPADKPSDWFVELHSKNPSATLLGVQFQVVYGDVPDRGLCALAVRDPDPPHPFQDSQARLCFLLRPYSAPCDTIPPSEVTVAVNPDDKASAYDIPVLLWAGIERQPQYLPLLGVLSWPSCFLNAVYGNEFLGRVHTTAAQQCWVSVSGDTELWSQLRRSEESFACVWQPSAPHCVLRSSPQCQACGCVCKLLYGSINAEDGCAWFIQWIKNVERAKIIGQELLVVYHEGALSDPRGPDAMDGVPFSEMRQISLSGWRTMGEREGWRYLGNNQRLEVAWLKHVGYAFTSLEQGDVVVNADGIVRRASPPSRGEDEAQVGAGGGEHGSSRRSLRATAVTVEEWDAVQTFKQRSNGRFDKLSVTGLRTDWRANMRELASRQRSIGLQRRPLLAIWGVDTATDGQLEALTMVTRRFLSEVKPRRLMLSGKRALAVADKAEVLLRRAFDGLDSHFRPEAFVTGGADGVDAVALRLTRPEEPLYHGLIAMGQFSPTPFARADVLSDFNPRPVELQGLSPGWSPLQAAEMMTMPSSTSDPHFGAFLALMEGQWEARDTYNAQLSDACIAFLGMHKNPGGHAPRHDGTKATLNVFAEGRYIYPIDGFTQHWEIDKAVVVPLDVLESGPSCTDCAPVAYKLLHCHDSSSSAFPLSDQEIVIDATRVAPTSDDAPQAMGRTR